MTRTHRYLFPAFILVSVAAAGCSTKSPQANGSGGTTGSAGAGGEAPLSASGGAGGARSTGIATNHRAAPQVCSGPGVDGSVVLVDGGSAGDGGAMLSCTQDSDCVGCPGGQLGRCEGPLSSCVCDQCLTDQDCGATSVCACNGQTFGWSHTLRGNVCVPGNCRVDEDCGPGGFCSPTTDLGCGAFYGVSGFYCHTANDRCTNDADCAQGTCRFSPQSGFWVCAAGGCAG